MRIINIIRDEDTTNLIFLSNKSKSKREKNKIIAFILLLAKSTPIKSNKIIINNIGFLFFFLKRNNDPKIDNNENFCI